MSKENFNRLKTLLEADRSIRRFDASAKIDIHILRDIVSLTRLCASGRNIQPLKYCLVNTPELCDAIFPHLAWAGYYQDWPGPDVHQRPTAYIIQMLDRSIATSCLCDDGLHLQAISLGATALGLGGCIIKSFNNEALSRILSLPEQLKILYVYALGVPAEHAVIKDMMPGDDYKYFRDAEDRQCVPKRQLEETIYQP